MGFIINPYRHAGVAGFTPLSLGSKLLAWWDPSDLTTLDKSGPTPVTAPGDAVFEMRDKSGNAHHQNQTTSANRPTYQVDGSGNAYLLFDGTNDVMNITGAIFFTMPFERLTAMQQITWQAQDHIWFGAGTGSAGSLNQSGSPGVSPQLSLLDGSGTNILLTSDLPLTTNGVVTERHVAAASQLAVDNNAYATANAGSSNPVNCLLGATATGANAVNMRFYGAVICNGTLTSGEIAQLRTYLGNKCGLTL